MIRRARSLGFIVVASLVAAACGGSEDAAPENDPTVDDGQDALRSGYSATVTTIPDPVALHAVTRLDVRVNGRSGPVTQFDLLHTEKMHLIAVSSDLEDFLHVHPALQPAGDLTVDAV